MRRRKEEAYVPDKVEEIELMQVNTNPHLSTAQSRDAGWIFGASGACWPDSRVSTPYAIPGAF